MRKVKNPTRVQIRRRAEEIRAGWDEATLQRRAVLGRIHWLPVVYRPERVRDQFIFEEVSE